MPRSRTLLAAIAVGMLFPATSNAGTVTVPNGFTESTRDMLGVFSARPGEQNVLTMRARAGNSMEFTDTGAPIAGQVFDDSAGCASLPGGVSSVLCEPVFHAEVHLGNKDDRADFLFNSGGVVIWAGPGDDVAVADSFGSPTMLYGEGGDDELASGGELVHLVDGGPGDDLLRAGGWAGDSTGLGGPGNDRITYRIGLAFNGAGELQGGPGRDHISMLTQGRAVAHGDTGADVLDVTPNDPSERWFSDFTFYGDEGPDQLSGGPDADVLDGGSGPDTIDATGGRGSDTITCGPGKDTVLADTADSIADDCESVTLLPADES